MELYLTGNINLRVPFACKGKSGSGSEIMLPFHCAIQGGSEELLRWLVDVQYCRAHDVSTDKAEIGVVAFGVMDMIKSVASNTGTNDFFKPTLKTSKGRSLLDIAMKSRHVGILRYLINKNCVSVYEVGDLDLALGAVDALGKSGSFNHELFTGDKVSQNIDKGWKAGACDAEVKVNA